MAANISKVFILDKYFKELQKFWETEKKLQGSEKASFVGGKSIALFIHVFKPDRVMKLFESSINEQKKNAAQVEVE